MVCTFTSLPTAIIVIAGLHAIRATHIFEPVLAGITHVIGVERGKAKRMAGRNTGGLPPHITSKIIFHHDLAPQGVSNSNGAVLAIIINISRLT